MYLASAAPERFAAVLPGVSVIIPTYRPVDVVATTLGSLAAQTLDPSRMEVQVVVNGRSADEVAGYSDLAHAFHHLRVRVHVTPRAGTSHALNLGIRSARCGWVTFVDDDDTVTAGFMKGLLDVAAPGVIPITMVDDVDFDGTRHGSTLLNEQLLAARETIVAPESVPRGLGLNVAKLVPTAWARAVGHRTELRSGHDVAFWAELYARYDFDFAIVPPHRDAVYLRRLTESSLSRQHLTWDFAIRERIDVIASLDRLCDEAPAKKTRVITSLMNSQARFANRYLHDHLDEVGAVREYIHERAIRRFPWKTLNESLARTLVVSVCFPPFSDASAVTAAKRVHDLGVVVDVVTNDMSAVRPYDTSLDAIAGEYVARLVRLTSPPSFGDADAARRFATDAWEALRPDSPSDWPYTTLYSRAMWPASHVAAGWIKCQLPSTRWIAEFSDPLSLTVGGGPRPGSLELDDFVRQLLERASAVVGVDPPEPSTIFDLAEVVPYALAQELWFTNEHQLTYMLDHIDCPRLRDVVIAKAQVRPHPTPADSLYYLSSCSPPFDHGRVRIAYFGSFYANRSLGDVIDALSSLPGRHRARIRLDIYAEGEGLGGQILDLGLGDVVHIVPRVNYLHFLNLTTKYDCLIVNDAATRGTHRVNPYLPSKWSDYRGSGTPVWALVEPGSTLSKTATAYRSTLGDVAGARAVLSELAELLPASKQRQTELARR